MSPFRFRPGRFPAPQEHIKRPPTPVCVGLAFAACALFGVWLLAGAVFAVSRWIGGSR